MQRTSYTQACASSESWATPPEQCAVRNISPYVIAQPPFRNLHHLQLLLPKQAISSTTPVPTETSKKSTTNTSPPPPQPPKTPPTPRTSFIPTGRQPRPPRSCRLLPTHKPLCTSTALIGYRVRRSSISMRCRQVSSPRTCQVRPACGSGTTGVMGIRGLVWAHRQVTASSR